MFGSLHTKIHQDCMLHVCLFLMCVCVCVRVRHAAICHCQSPLAATLRNSLSYMKADQIPKHFTATILTLLSTKIEEVTGSYKKK